MKLWEMFHQINMIVFDYKLDLAIIVRGKASWYFSANCYSRSIVETINLNSKLDSLQTTIDEVDEINIIVLNSNKVDAKTYVATLGKFDMLDDVNVVITPMRLDDSPPDGYNSFSEVVADQIIKIVKANNVA